MKRKLQFLKMLLVAVGLCAGVTSAWGDEVTTTFDFSQGTAGTTPTLSTTAHHKAGNASNVFLATDALCNSRICFQAVDNANNVFNYANSKLQNLKGDRWMSVVDLQAGDRVIFTFNAAAAGSSTNKFFTVENAGTGNTTNLSLTSGGDAITANTDIVSGTTYYVLADGYIDMKTRKNFYLSSIVIKRDVADDFVASPAYTITGANNNARSFTLDCATEGSEIYYSTSSLATAEGGIKYTSEVETEETTIWAYAKKGSNTSEVISFSTGAGSTLTLAIPAISATGFTNTTGASVDNPTFNFSCNNSAIVGQPVATLSYTFTPAGGTESAVTEGTSYTPTTYGTLKVTASASGYASSEKSLVVSNYYIVSFTGRDYTTAATTDCNEFTWGEAYTPTWTGWESGLTAYLMTATNKTDMLLNISNPSTISLVSGWGFVRGDQNSYGYRVREALQGTFVAVKQNSSKGADASANTYNTVFCTAGTGQAIDVVTINVPAGNALQQIFKYSPAPSTVSATLDAAGYATLASPYALDVTPANMTASAGSATAYKAAVAGTKVNFTDISGNIEANTGILLKGEANATVTIPVVASGLAVSGNAFLVNTTGEKFTADDDYYYFAMKKGEATLTFATFAPGTLAFPANKAYLKVAKSNFPTPAPSLTAIFDDGNTTGINAVKNAQFTENGEYYNLAGQRVAQPTKGLYIVNGRKVVVK